MQIIKPDEGTYGLSFVFVAGEENLIPENIKSGVSIYGVEGTGLKLQDKAFVPTGKVMVCYPDEGYDGFSFVGIGGDNNLLPENIKKDITIYGVTGSLEGGGENTSAGGATIIPVKVLTAIYTGVPVVTALPIIPVAEYYEITEDE